MKALIISYTLRNRNGERVINSGPVFPMSQLFPKIFDIVIFIEQPLPESLDGYELYLEIYEKGELRLQKRAGRILNKFLLINNKWEYPTKTYIRFKLRDIFSIFVFWRYIKQFAPFDLIIGIESIDAIMGALIKRVLGAKYLVYYTFDYSDKRYANKIMNSLFLWLDKEACKLSTHCWNVTNRVHENRLIRGYKETQIGKPVEVPTGIDLELIKKVLNQVTNVKRNQIIFTGGHTFANGAHLIPKILSHLSKYTQDFLLVITGAGPLTNRLKEEIKEMGFSEKVLFTGFIESDEETFRLIAESRVGIAPYPDIEEATKKFGEVIKIKNYLALGVPVVTTDVPPISEKVKALDMGIVVKDRDWESFAEAIYTILSNEELYNKFRENALKFSSTQTWEKILLKALKETGLDIDF